MWIEVDICGDEDEEETPKEPVVVPRPKTQYDNRLQKQVININGEIVSVVD